MLQRIQTLMAPQVNTTIRHISVGVNDITDLGGVMFASAFLVNRTVTHSQRLSCVSRLFTTVLYPNAFPRPPFLSPEYGSQEYQEYGSLLLASRKPNRLQGKEDVTRKGTAHHHTCSCCLDRLRQPHVSWCPQGGNKPQFYTGVAVSPSMRGFLMPSTLPATTLGTTRRPPLRLC